MSQENSDARITFENYGHRGQFVFLDGPQSIVRLTVQGWPLAVDRFLAQHAVLCSVDGQRERLRPWHPFRRQAATRITAGDYYDFDEPTTPCLNFPSIVPLPSKIHFFDDPYGVARATLRGRGPDTVRRCVLEKTGVDIANPALSWHERYALCARSLSQSWQKSLAEALPALENQQSFGHETIESWAMEHWGGHNGLGPSEPDLVGNDPVSHSLQNAPGHRAVAFVFLVYNGANDVMPIPAPIFDMLAISHPLLNMTLAYRAVDPRHDEWVWGSATSRRGLVTWEEPGTWSPHEEQARLEEQAQRDEAS